MEQGKPSKPSKSQEFTSSESTQNEAILLKYKCILQTWANKIAMLPFDIIIAFLAASWGTQNGNCFPAACFPYHLFLLMLMLGFYSSVAGIILWPIFPEAARAFYLVAFLCILLALTLFFASLLPEDLRDVPWVCFAFVSFLVFGLAVYEECRLN